MNMSQQGLEKKYAELKKIHYQALHELADAAQIIKSYEYLERQYKRENALLHNVLATANQLCETNEMEAFLKKRADLIRAIQKYRASIGLDMYRQEEVS
ncbi:MAG: hypothetical protein D6743_09110 [Calditrichaeota bacterium]|nr:MAG: hypothetical protein D6743_09110 [Calditrichota bacterium]